MLTYRKRPKTNVRSITSMTVLIELSRCLITKERTPILIQEALEFLKAMDNLDLYVGVPNAVDEHLYVSVCRHRRLKIESEIKVPFVFCMNVEKLIKVCDVLD